MTVSETIKEIDNIIEQNKAQYDLDRQLGKISTLFSGSVGKYEFSRSENILYKKELLNKLL